MTLVFSECFVKIYELFYVFGVAFKTQTAYILLVEGVLQKYETTLSIVFEDFFSIDSLSGKAILPSY